MRKLLIILLFSVECWLTYLCEASMLLSATSFSVSAIWFCMALTEHTVLGFAITPGDWGDIIADVIHKRHLKRPAWRTKKIPDRAILTTSFMTLFGGTLLFFNREINADLKISAIPILGGMILGCLSGYFAIVRR